MALNLPFEVEWELTAKGGQNFEYAGSDNIYEAAWIDEDEYEVTTHSACSSIKAEWPRPIRHDWKYLRMVCG